MRSSYINYFYSDIKTMKEKEHLSNQMRHSVLTAQTNYLKIDKSNTKEEKDTIITDLQNKIYDLQNNNQIEVKIEDKKYKKNRYDIIFKLNSNPDQKPREDTLKKYNIKYDGQLKKYL